MMMKKIKISVFGVFILLIFNVEVFAQDNNHIILYPTSANWSEELGQWTLPIRGHFYEKNRLSPLQWIISKSGKVYAWLEKREDVKEQAKGEVDSDDPSEIADSELMKKRSRPFFFSGKESFTATIFLGDQSWELNGANDQGYFDVEIKLSHEELLKHVSDENVLRYSIQFSHESKLRQGIVYVVKPEGYSVISDIDDTIKYSEVFDKEELFENSMLYPFSSIAGMPEWYQQLENCGASFHYVSKSPWQLFEPLQSFLTEDGYPGGSIYLRHQNPVGLKALWKAAGPTKKEYIRDIIKRYPKRKFILVGDSTQKDPTVYSAIAEEFPEQIEHIYIRKVKNKDDYLLESLEGFKVENSKLWTLFSEAGQLKTSWCP